jgi:hypothetical protein
VYAFAGKQLGDIQSVEDIFSARIAVAFLLLALLVLFPVIANYFRGKKLNSTIEHQVK